MILLGTGVEVIWYSHVHVCIYEIHTCTCTCTLLIQKLHAA